jgi:hypothetical protein
MKDKDHQWNGCVCTLCHSKRDEAHSWVGCLCSRCGKEHDLKEGEFEEEAGFEAVGVPSGISAADGFAYLRACFEIFKECRLCGKRISVGRRYQ